MRYCPDYSDDGFGTKVKKALHILAWVIIIGNMVFLGLILFWLLFPYNPADIKVPIEIQNPNKEIAAGDKIRMFIILDKHSDTRPDGSRYLTCKSGNTVAFEGIATSRPIGHSEYINDNYILPPSVQAGDVCKFNFKNYYKVNPIRTITEVWYSEEFKVIKGADTQLQPEQLN